ncbi:MAG TPA: sigma-70 family RNA polymerase sigma factor [Chthoniobacterales bacterium]|nr:sigma-70 family RNA polymerase sigma factor [Chthoniobacterales bacterium]
MNAVSETAARISGNGAFVTTRWSLVMDAQAESPLAQHALEELCRVYWRPIYSFLRRERRTPEDAQDLTQDFFAQLLERGDFAAVRREKGRLRSYLLGSLKHFLANDRRRAMARKRGEGRVPISFDCLRTEEGFEGQESSPDRVYDRRWALTVLDQVFARLMVECRHLGRPGLTDRLCELLSGEPDRPAQSQIAREFGMTENAVKQAFHRLRQRYRELLRDEVAQTVATPADVEKELRELMVALRP